MSSVLGRVQRVRHELKFRDLTVVRVRDVTPHLRAVTFTDESLADFVSPSFDDHVKLFIDTGAEEPARRDYTPRSFDNAARELTLEFVLHGDGPAAGWAAQAAPGQRVRIGGPRGSFLIPLDYDWHLLVGDETAFPAIARRLEELPAGARALVVLQVPDEADRPVLTSEADVAFTWVTDGPALLAALKAMDLPPGEGYVWAAGEASEMAELRRILVDEKGHDKRAIRAAAYWKRGATAHHENLEA
ncbi:MAG TPA: siderophore-interacting protein [Ideonella sp.]|uniref:siderophore-interacting protein n=1 Tax=Ideonella sp. TaxID=1929293 RepID=UPI002E2EB109|nr:siderophore-interacting protein [Ideonella sp.]HEX5686352.1 siderophore-interacting protein [Ideonella sp.]